MEYEFDAALPEIDPDLIIKNQWDLDIGEWEMNRTHWAVKDVDLFPVLMEAGVLDPKLIHSQPKRSKIITLGLDRPTADIEARPTVFMLPDAKKEIDLVSVMMPFSKAFDGTYAAIQEVCKLTKLRCERADNIGESSEIMQDIFSLIYQSQYVICDFTGANPNVFYETGIAHTLGRIVIPIAQNFDHVSFDLRHHRFIKYLDNGEGLAALSKALAKHLDTLRRLSSPAATNTSA